MNRQPTASIIISAYNRPKVITYAMRSVLESDFDDWEMIVVGDGCNTDTEEAITSISDPRLKFYNLPENTGHQSEPHNKGVEMARGEYIFFLNQDDMYFPDHLSARIDFMRRSGADLAWSPVFLLQRSGIDKGPIDPDTDRLIVDGAVANGRFDPQCFIISSSWTVRREVCRQVGPWLPVGETRLSPSQEWLYRASSQNRNMAYHPHLSVLCIHSGVRRYSYVSVESDEHERAWTWIAAGPEERSRLLECTSVQMAGDLFESRKQLERTRRPLLTAAQSAFRRFRIHPDAVQRFYDGLSKGSWVHNHTKFTNSAPPLIGLNQIIRFGETSADVYVGRGWHHPEPNGRWSCQETAEIYFTVAEPDQCLELSGHPFRSGDKVEFSLNHQKTLVTELPRDENRVVIPVHSAGVNLLTIRVTKPTSPKKQGQSGDQRTLGFWLASIRLVPTDTHASV